MTEMRTQLAEAIAAGSRAYARMEGLVDDVEKERALAALQPLRAEIERCAAAVIRAEAPNLDPDSSEALHWLEWLKVDANAQLHQAFRGSGRQ